MSIFSALRLNRAVAPSGQAAAPAIRSPWTTGQLQRVVFADIFGVEGAPVSRAEAMSVPAVAKARLLVSSLAANPLRAYRGEALLPEQPTFLYRTSSQVHPVVRMIWTLDDLLFTGWSLWAVERGTRGQITDAVRVPPELWTFDSAQRVTVNNEPAKSEDVVLFSGPHEGLLEIGARTVRGARALEEAWTQRVKNPVPVVELRQTQDESLTDAEVDDIIDGYVKARQDPNGTVAFTPFGVEMHVHGDVRHELFIEGRNAVRLDVANLTGLPASLLDGSLSTASLTYSTQEGKRSEWLDAARSTWLAPVAARLSQDDVVPAGQRVDFDLSNLMEVPASGLAPVTED